MVESGPEGPTSEVMRDSLRARARFFWCRRREREAEVGAAEGVEEEAVSLEADLRCFLDVR